MKNVLIIRSVSFQQLDLNLTSIKKRFSPCSISLLTHEHGVKLAEKYKDIDKIFVYPYREGFDKKNKVDEIKNIDFDVVVVPVTNISGDGFFNVLKFAQTIKHKKMVMCNVVSDIVPYSETQVHIMAVKNVFMNIFSTILMIILAPFVLIMLLFKLRGIHE